MTAYRFQARYLGKYFSEVVHAPTAEDAGLGFAKLIADGKIQAKPEGVYTPNRLYVTYEEIDEQSTSNPGQEDKLGK